ncbi:hypothetical protein FB45DRAFT_956423, partial [Roridomyces roridus]
MLKARNPASRLHPQVLLFAFQDTYTEELFPGLRLSKQLLKPRAITLDQFRRLSSKHGRVYYSVSEEKRGGRRVSARVYYRSEFSHLAHVASGALSQSYPAPAPPPPPFPYPHCLAQCFLRGRPWSATARPTRECHRWRRSPVIRVQYEIL